MEENESFAYQVRNNQADASKSAEISLITQERAQKLDLLIHLISNLRQSLVICGVNGIGKTTLLTEFSKRKSDLWPILKIKATSNSSYESLQDQIDRFIRQSDRSFEHQEFTAILSNLEKQNQKIAIIFENAGQLIPGLISALIQYATKSHSIRLVFSLTHDELQLKTSSDKVIDSCHYIEIPPLTENQCGLFLQHLSRQPNAIVSFQAINERMIAKLYQETHGIPGKIMSALPTLSNYRPSGGFKGGVTVILAFIITVGVSFFILNEPKETFVSVAEKQVLVLPEPKMIEISSPVIMQEALIEEDFLIIAQDKDESEPEITSIVPNVSPVNIEVEKDLENVFLNKTVLIKQPIIEKVEVEVEELIEDEEFKKEISPQLKPEENNTLESAKKIVVDESESDRKEILNEVSANKKVTIAIKDKKKPRAVEDKKELKISHVIKDNKQWVLAQAEKQYTIQLMALSTRESVIDFFNKNRKLNDKLKYFRMKKQGKSLFVLIYGSYKDLDTASKEMKSLPVKYRKSWVRRFGTLQKSIKN